MYATSVVLVIAVVVSWRVNGGACSLHDGKLAGKNTELHPTNASQAHYGNLQEKKRNYRNNATKHLVHKDLTGNRNGETKFEEKQTGDVHGQSNSNNSNATTHLEIGQEGPRIQGQFYSVRSDGLKYLGLQQQETRKAQQKLSQKSNDATESKQKESRRRKEKFDIHANSVARYLELNQKRRMNRHSVSLSDQTIFSKYRHHHHHVHHHHHHRHHHHHHHHHQRTAERHIRKDDTSTRIHSTHSAHSTRRYLPHFRFSPRQRSGYGRIQTARTKGKGNREKSTQEKFPAVAEKRFIVVGGPHGHHLKRFHFSPALVSALRLVLDKRNSFKKDTDILNLAQALQSKDSSDSNVGRNNSITTAVSSGLTRNGQRVRLVTVKDPGYTKAKVHREEGPLGYIKPKVHREEGLLKQVAHHSADPGHAKAHGHQQKGQLLQATSHYKGPGFLKAKVHGQQVLHREATHHIQYPGHTQAKIHLQEGPGYTKDVVHLGEGLPRDIGYTKTKVHLREGQLRDPGYTKARVRSQGDLLRQAAYRSKISEDLRPHPHTALVNPTELGISILKLLFGKRANLVVKPKYKLLVGGRPGLKYLEGYGTSRQRTELQKEIEQENKMILLKGVYKKKFEKTLAKSVSNLIAAINKNEAANPGKEGVATVHKTGAKATRKITVDQRGTRKSWVLLKLPKNGEKEDENVERYQDNEPSIKQVTTVGKHNNMMTDVKVTHHHKPEITSSYDTSKQTKKPKDIPVDTPSRSVPQISYDLSAIKTKNELSKTPNSDSTAVSTTLGKILKGIQDSIKELKQQRKSPSESVTKVVEKVTSLSPLTSRESLTSSDTPPVSLTSSDTSEAASVAKIPDLLAAVNKLLGAHSTKIPPMPGVPSDQTGSESSAISVPTVDTQADAARRYVDDVRASNNPLLPRPVLGMYDEPITTSSRSKNTEGQQPGDNVLFESDELATQRDSQSNIDAMKLKEDLEAFAEKGLNAHNRYRSLHHAPTLKWSDELATQAEKMAYGMAMKGSIEKSNVATTLGYGENVAKMTGTIFNRAGEEATSLWYAEIANYSFSDPRLSPQTDSFTQVVWKGTSKLGMGCARDLQTNDLYVVALYDPKANDPVGLRSNVVNKGGVTEDVYASIFKRHKLHPSG